MGFIFQFFLKKYREKQFQEATLEFISGIILKMKSGESFRNAFYEEVQGSEGYFREQIQIIYKTVVYSQHNVELTTNKLSSEFVLLLKKVDLQPHLSIRLLENYRKLKFKLKTIRRRSQESLRSIRAQSVLLGLFYMILLVFSLTNYNFNQYLEVYLASLVLFIFGITISVNIGGRVKWKV
ncbi:MAG: hypothetical protein HOO06_02300 [Bdellovibrionaceae bacterium]|nr:hypothetical protein [Pseudobdellovibrionaceae bacterium]